MLTAQLSNLAEIAIGVDSSASMIAKAKEQYANIQFVVCNALALPFEQQFDVVFSNAVFHWIADHEALLKQVHKVLKLNGLLVCEFGANGNIATIENAFIDISIFSQTIPTMFVRIFLQDEHLIRLASTCIQRYAAGLLGVAVQYAFVDGLTAMGQIQYAMPLSLFRKVLYIGAVLLIPLFLPLDIVFWAETICDLGGAAVTLVVFIMIIKPNLKKVCQ